MFAIQRAFRVLATVALIGLATATDINEFCTSITSCLRDGSITCDTASGGCPPCIYALDNTYTCWEKDNLTNTCPFTGVRYDCSASWSSTTSSEIGSAILATPSSSTNSTGSTDSSSSSSDLRADTSSSSIFGGSSYDLILYGAIGFGAMLIFGTVAFLCLRKRKNKRHPDESSTFGGVQNAVDKRMRGVSKRDDSSSGPYNNILDTSKVNYVSGINSGYGRYSKGSRHDRLDPSSHVPIGRARTSFDGILADSSQSPAVLGGSARRSLKNGRCSNKESNGGVGGFSHVSEYVQQDVSSRCSSTSNVFGEYLRTKQEMQYDDAGHSHLGEMSGISFSGTISDLDSGKYSFESLQGISRPPQLRLGIDSRLSVADSITDSEYGEQLRGRGESDCDSEMSYNDEKYSFSSVDSLDDSQVREGKREVEI
ncbi:RxLR-like protein [Plasmopara halstedii]|uniref:RxLR-like protein n=1 Tax=Plasmopara halstedii TaxID=4781 RepID=A0A0P1AH30_PLAHL|nr:RxLR-like protein [Plasmopara halstedii]CEG40206.1 RxLR-like protein [Plasmopara halstedii]|eukprot:XP_024576575.1 RxLR-like protein [Plasmopara halstedii]